MLLEEDLRRRLELLEPFLEGAGTNRMGAQVGAAVVVGAGVRLLLLLLLF